MARTQRAAHGRVALIVWVLAAALLLIACTPDDPQPEPAVRAPATEPSSESAAEPTSLPQAANSPREDAPSAVDNMRDEAFPDALIDPDQILSGGPPPDGIPAIDEPKFQHVDDVDWLAETAALLAITIDGDTRGYPFQILTWHEIVNDTVGGVPVAVTYCPLCNSGVGFDRRVDGKVLDFGTSGRLYASNLVMYDRQTESLWPQLTGQASVGVMTGAKLEFVPVFPVGWSDFREAHPDAWVLSRDTGHSRDYGRNPYVGYDTDPDRDPLFGAPTEDDRLPPMERVIALEGKTETVAVLRAAVEAAGVLTETIDDRPVVLFFTEGQASALETASVAGGRDIGTVAVFDPIVDGKALSFDRDGHRFTDAQTGSTWNIRGQAIGGPLAGAQLTGYPFIDTFWKSWVAFVPDTRIADERT
ncbi:MAG: DUF3179 domain-containing protein [Acidimicrobiales bacterium]